MVDIATHSKSRIVVGSNDIGHIDPSTQPLGKCYATLDDHIGMVAAVGGIEALDRKSVV